MFEGNDSVVKAMQEVSNLSCDDCKHYNQRLKECVLGKHCKDARAILFKAASMQVPLAHGYDSVINYDYGVARERRVWVCPSCGNYYDDYVQFNFCPECGQKIEWGESGEEEKDE